jgi:hypothetical protein
MGGWRGGVWRGGEMCTEPGLGRIDGLIDGLGAIIPDYLRVSGGITTTRPRMHSYLRFATLFIR